MKRKLNLLYFSPTDGTKKIVKEIAKGMDLDYKDFNITLVENRKDELYFDENDIVIGHFLMLCYNDNEKEIRNIFLNI